MVMTTINQPQRATYRKNFPKSLILEKQIKEYYCGPACMSGILCFFGVVKDQNSVAYKAKTNKRNGTKTQKLINVFTEYGLNAISQDNAKFKDIVNNLSKNSVVILLVDSENEGHYIVVKQSNGDRLKVADPYYPAEYWINKNELEKIWYSVEENLSKWMCVVTKE